MKPNFPTVLALAHHYKAIGQTDIVIDYHGAPWEHVTKIRPSSYRLSIPDSLAFVAEIDGFILTWFVDLESRSADGTGTHQFLPGKLLRISRLLPPHGRTLLLSLFQQEVLPAVEKRRDQILDAYNNQDMSLTALRRTIEFMEDDGA